MLVFPLLNLWLAIQHTLKPEALRQQDFNHLRNFTDTKKDCGPLEVKTFFRAIIVPTIFLHFQSSAGIFCDELGID